MSIEGARVTIDGREIEVPAGTGLVEAAAAADIEIPVFCYEPRIGPAVGACRMCLVEIEGMPKLQTACSTPVRDGMVVSTVGDRARDAQEAVLEFLLINHPLDCPVCDKGGECPLQDHAYRWGPGESRFHELKRNADKPIPVSPLIALDRERCILCYRCTRFSAEVSGDNQLIARQRGANSVIATFEGQPYAGHFSGNIIELCPVGALTSTEYRFRGRPWETVDHPTTCTLCPVGCSAYATVREGSVIRMLARENPAVDGGWLCDRGRFSYASLDAPQRLVTSYERLHRGRPEGNRPTVDVSIEVAVEQLYQRLTGSAPALWILSGSETLEEAFAITRVASATGGRVVAVDGASAAAPGNGASFDDVEQARHLLVIGDADLAETAPILDLRVRKAVRNGASLTTAGIGGTRLDVVAAHHDHVEPGKADEYVASFCERMEAAGQSFTETGVVIYRDGELSADAIDKLAKTLQLERDGCGFVAVPAAPNARGLAALDIEPVGVEALEQHDGGFILYNVDLGRHYDPARWWPALERAPWAVAVAALPAREHEICDIVVPATAYQEKDGTSVNLEGRLQRLNAAADAPGAIRSELRWLAGLSRRLGTNLPGHAAGVFRVAAQQLGSRLPVSALADIPDGGVLGVHGGPRPRSAYDRALAGDDGQLTIFVAPFLYDGADVDHSQRMGFLTETAGRITVARDDAHALGIGRGDTVNVRFADGSTLQVKAAVSKRVAPGFARMFAGTAGLPSGRTGYRAAVVDAIDEPSVRPAGVSGPGDAGQDGG